MSNRFSIPDPSADRDARGCAVIGGGISGLVAAFTLSQRGMPVTLFEAADRPGGVIRTVRHDGFLADLGPNTLVTRDETLPELIDALGLSTEVVRAPASAAIRYIVRDRAPVPLPRGPVEFARTPLLSAGAKFRLLMEPTIRRRSEAEPDESMADFVRRRLGPEVLDYIVDPFVSGVFAGDPERLSVRHALPLLTALEAEHGSLLWGAVRRISSGREQKAGRIDRTPFGFQNGMDTLPAALADQLGRTVRTGHRVTDVVPVEGGFKITAETADGFFSGEFPFAVLALPPAALSGLSIVPEESSAILSTIPVPPVATLALGFPRDAVQDPLRGFGMLVPSREPFRLLGTLFSSSLFPGRAPGGRVLLTCFLGGRRKPEEALLTEERQVEIVLAELRQLLGVTGFPTVVIRHVWNQAIPQYELGYDRVVEALASLEIEHRGLAVAGNIRRGVSIGDAAASGIDAAGHLLAQALLKGS